MSDSAKTIAQEQIVEAILVRSKTQTTLRRLGKVLLFTVSLFLFILAITLMKEGARDLAPLVRDGFRVTNPANSLGFGWLFAILL